MTVILDTNAGNFGLILSLKIISHLYETHFTFLALDFPFFLWI
jgi:hypothetical protein